MLPARLRHRFNALQTYTEPVPADRSAPTVDPAVLTLLAAACRDQERLRFGYRGYDGSASIRAVEPHRLVLLASIGFTATVDWLPVRAELTAQDGRVVDVHPVAFAPDGAEAHFASWQSRATSGMSGCSADRAGLLRSSRGGLPVTEARQ